MNWANKALIRRMALGNLPRKNMLLMPGIGAFDVEEGVRLGVITPFTELLLVEKKLANLLGMVSSLVKILPNTYKMPKFHLGPLSSVVLENDLDFFWADLYGNFDLATVGWIFHHLTHRLKKNATVVFTLAVCERANRLHHEVKELVRANLVSRSPSALGVASHLVCLHALFGGWNYVYRFVTYKNKQYGTPMALYVMSGLRRKRRAMSPIFAQMI